MKLGLITLVTAMLACWFAAFAFAKTAPVTHEAPVPAMEVPPPTVDIPAPQVIQVPDITIVGYVPAKHPHVASKKHFVCGEMYTNTIGGRNSDCEWK